MALTNDQIQAYAKLKTGYWDWVLGKTGGEILTGEQYQVLELEIISQQLAQLVVALTGLSPGSTTQETITNIINPVGGSITPSPSVVISWDPSRLDEIISLTEGLAGSVSDTITQFPLTVPASGSITVAIPPPPQSVAKLFSPLVITTTDVGAQVTVTATVDGHNVIGQQGFVLGPSTDIPFHQFAVAQQQGMQITLTNPSSAAVTIYFQAELLVMTQTFYSKYYHPIVQGAFSYIKQNFGLSS